MKRLLGVLLLSACSPVGGTGDGGAGGSGAGGGFALPQLPPIASLAVFGTGATKLLADVANARVEIDPTQSDALTALGKDPATKLVLAAQETLDRQTLHVHDGTKATTN